MAEQKITEERKRRMKELVDWVKATKETPRKTSLSHFAEKHRVDYNTVKKDLRALSYASKPGPRGYDLRYIPKSYRKDVEKLWNEFKGDKKHGFERGGEIDINKAREASDTFLKHHPQEDVERLTELCESEVKEEEKGRLRELAEEVAEKYKEAS